MPTPLVSPKPEKKKKNHILLKKRRKRRDRERRQKRKNQKEDDIKKKVQEIKSKNLVHNFSSQDIPDDAYLYLALGNTFAIVKDVKRHDHVFDGKLFGRKIAWAAYHHKKSSEPEPNGEDVSPSETTETLAHRWDYPDELSPSGSSWPPETDKRVENLLEELKRTIEQAPKKKRTTNMTHREVAGLKWCREKVRSRVLYITRADKGGSIYIFDADTVSSIIDQTLQDQSKYSPLPGDPRKSIRKNLNEILDTFIQKGSVTKSERFLITGKTEHDGQSHSPDFVMTKLHTYPLFKEHKLKKEDFDNKAITPTRMVTAALNGPTYRLGPFLNHVLKDVAKKY